MRTIETTTALLISACIFGQAHADGADISITCQSPSFTEALSKHGTSVNERGRGSSPTFQFNINTREGGAVRVDKNSDGVCTIKISSGYRILSGKAVVDENNIYTDFNTDSSVVKPPRGEILKEIDITSSNPEVDTMKFTVHSTSTKYKGTININFTVDYERAQ